MPAASPCAPVAPAPLEPDPTLSSRAEWARRYGEIRRFTEELSQPLQPEDCVVQSMPDASPVKWHLAHTSWFFETFVLSRGLAGYRPPDSLYSYLFNSYYNAVGPMHCRPRRGLISRPTVEQTYRYRKQVDAAMLDFFAHASEDGWRELEPSIVLGCHHEQQHQELLLTDVKHMLSENPLFPRYTKEPRSASQETAGSANVPFQWVRFPEGIHWIGSSDQGFCFDNETPRHRVFLDHFQLASRPVTNGEYLAFMGDGGYMRPEFWLSLGWFTVKEQNWQAPLYWQKGDGQWLVFTLSGLCTVEPAEPVCHLSYFEADAFARWAGARLPTEAEWEVACAQEPTTGHFVEQRRFHPAPGGESQPGRLDQMFGDVWEWTRSSYAPYPRYEPAKGAIGEYNGKFMCNQYVLRGGSCATSQSHFRRTYRNFFPPDKRWQFMGLRLAKDGA